MNRRKKLFVSCGLLLVFTLFAAYFTHHNKIQTLKENALVMEGDDTNFIVLQEIEKNTQYPTYQLTDFQYKHWGPFSWYSNVLVISKMPDPSISQVDCSGMMDAEGYHIYIIGNNLEYNKIKVEFEQEGYCFKTQEEIPMGLFIKKYTLVPKLNSNPLLSESFNVEFVE